MPSVLTLTMNPALDVSAPVDKGGNKHKLRCCGARFDPGGGVNVAHVIQRLGDEATALYACAGAGTRC
jgi:6-phosphofructokinase 2